MRPAISPDGKWLVYGTRHKTQTGLRVRNLETGAERWLAHPVTRDDQESRASRDTLPRYDFMPDGKSLMVPIGGKLQRIDFATGARDADSVHGKGAGRDRAARLHTGPRRRWPTRAGAADPLADAVARRHAPRLQRDEPALRHGSAGRHATTAAPSRPAALPKASSCRLVARRPVRSRTSHGRRRAGTSSACAADAAASRATLTRARGLLPRPDVHAGRVPLVFLSGAASDQLYSILRDTPPPEEQEPTTRCGRSAASTRPTRSNSDGCRQRAARPRSSRRRRTVAARISRATIPRACTSRRRAGCSRSRWTATTGGRTCAYRAPGPGNNPPGATEIRLSPDGTRAFVSLQGKHFWSPCLVPGARRSRCACRAARIAAVPVKRHVARGRRLSAVDRRRQERDLGLGRAVLPAGHRRR